jgi:hypothetical protein
MRLGNLFTVFLVAARILEAGYANLIATSDGNTLYAQATTEDNWFVRTAGGPVVSTETYIADVSGTGTTVARSHEARRICTDCTGTGWMSMSCSAEVSITGPGILYGYKDIPTFVRLSEAGDLAWIGRAEVCGFLSSHYVFGASGLFDVSSGRRVAAAGDFGLANARYGRRVILLDGRALVKSKGRLGWMSADGTSIILHRADAVEAVTDHVGRNIVYVEQSGALHWVEATDQDLGFRGEAPALTADGSYLVFLGRGGALQVYSRAEGGARQLAPGVFREFTVGGAYAFAVTEDNRVLRIGIQTGESAEWMPRFPEFRAAEVASFVLRCRPCFGSQPTYGLISPGMRVVVRGANFDAPDWRVRLGETDVPLIPIDSGSAWFQVPDSTPAGTYKVVFFHPEHGVRFTWSAHVEDRAFAC